MKIKTPTILATALTVAALGAPGVASAAPAGPGQLCCSGFYCGSSGNHNEVLIGRSLAGDLAVEGNFVVDPVAEAGVSLRLRRELRIAMGPISERPSTSSH